MSFWSIFTGNSPGIDQAKNVFSQTGGFGVGLGEADIGKSSKFWSDVTSGNSARIAQAMAAPISAEQEGIEQGRKAASEFHNRGGGTNSAVQSELGKARGDITSAVSNLQATGASELGKLGTSALSLGMEATGKEAELSELQLQNWNNSIFGGAIRGGVNYAESFLPIPHGG